MISTYSIFLEYYTNEDADVCFRLNICNDKLVITTTQDILHFSLTSLIRKEVLSQSIFLVIVLYCGEIITMTTCVN